MADITHPYMPNTSPEIRQEMLDVVGITDVDELFRAIPEELSLKRLMNLPEPFVSEFELEKHVRSLLGKNTTCGDFVNFLGAGCYQHHVPAVVDAMLSRGEFLTCYHGTTYTDGGRLQALFEYQSMLCELLEMDVAGYALTCGLQASSTAVRMAARITGRTAVLVPDTVNPRRLTHMKTYCRYSSELTDIRTVASDKTTGLLDLDDLRSKLTHDVAAILIENPTYLGTIESQAEEIGALAHEAGALLVAHVHPISMGVLRSPGDYGADIASGDTQALGIHMYYGGGNTGFIAVRDIPEHVAQLPQFLMTIAPTEDGEYFGFDMFTLPERLMYHGREEGVEFTGTQAALWEVANAVYLALMGPQGMHDIGESIVKKSAFAKQLLAKVPGVRTPLAAPHFSEFVVNFDDTGKTVAEINELLLAKGSFGGADLSQDFPALGQSALYCITEVHSVGEIKSLADALTEVTR
jgi:glycine dehydrogenase subunit 1